MAVTMIAESGLLLELAGPDEWFRLQRLRRLSAAQEGRRGMRWTFGFDREGRPDPVAGRAERLF
jgi:hypothetical protein